LQLEACSLPLAASLPQLPSIIEHHLPFHQYGKAINSYPKSSGMIYILWALLNVAAAVLFLGVCYRTIVLIKERFGTVLAFACAIFLMYTCNNSGGSRGNTAIASEVKKWKFDEEENYPGLRRELVDVTIDDNPMFGTLLTIEYAVTESGSIIPLSGFTCAEGFFSGVKWNFGYITISQEGPKLHYKVNGALTWSLMNMHIFTQSKTYKGTIDQSNLTWKHWN
jgi:hypothetical protein